MPAYITTLIVLKQNLVSELDLIIFWSSMALITIIPYTIYIYLRVKKSLKIKLETRNILKYFLSSIISFAIPFLISENLLEYSDNVFENNFTCFCAEAPYPEGHSPKGSAFLHFSTSNQSDIHIQSSHSKEHLLVAVVY